MLEGIIGYIFKHNRVKPILKNGWIDFIQFLCMDCSTLYLPTRAKPRDFE